MQANPQPLWQPGASLMNTCAMRRYMHWLGSEKGLHFPDYEQLWQWSVDKPAAFWESFYEWSGIITHAPVQEVLQQAEALIGSQWFTGARLNYAEHVFRHAPTTTPAIIFTNEAAERREISWAELERQTASLAAWMRSVGLKKGDRVASLMPNVPESVIAFLATQSIGAIWSSCSPDFGNPSILDRFAQIEPAILFVSDGYRYNGKEYPKMEGWRELFASLPTVTNVVSVSILEKGSGFRVEGSGLRVEGSGLRDGGSASGMQVSEPQPSTLNPQPLIPNTQTSRPALPIIPWDQALSAFPGSPLSFEPVPFDHPLWILYSSGTTGKPKAITHSVGGNLIEHLKVLLLHWDVRAGERFFWYSTTGWMMWNFSVASLLVGSTLVLYDGSAGHPDLHVLWQLAQQEKISHFGGGAAFFIACMKAGMRFREDDLPALRTIGSTGSPLPPEAFQWIYASVKKDVWLISFSGGTDICSGFVGGCPLLPVYPGEIQCRLLGCHLEAFNEDGKPVRGALGEMVILKPMPSMPVYFWNDEGNQRYRASYFEQYPGVWRHGDWIEITDRGSVIIYGRSDATLNRDGVRIGTSEIYSAVDAVPEVQDSLVVCVERDGGQYYMPLYVVMKPGKELNDEVRQRIRQQLRRQYSPRHVPDEIIAVPDIPYTISGKKMETPVKKILMGIPPEQAASKDTMRNPEALFYFG